ncbi:transposase [Streptomyces sp. NPDC090112]|uniref:transposase n=1 Tax=Streptomyces sp. NPDC090112 TaxID=3365949 RepID=UPI003807D829
MVNGVRWRVRTGVPWRDQPRGYGPWNTVYGLSRRRQREGVWGPDSPGGSTDAGEGVEGVVASDSRRPSSGPVP